MTYIHSEILPQLRKAGEKVQREFEKYACVRNRSRGEFIALEGDRCHYFYLVVSGSLRVYKGDEYGREITLYKVKPGESCILSAFCILNGGEFPANATAEEMTQLIEIPANVFRDWLDRHEFWRNYIFSRFSVHLANIISRVESLVFRRMDERIAQFLVHTASGSPNQVKLTHSDIARELGTAREVVSRILKNFEKARLIQLSRGNITIINQQGLFPGAGSRGSRQ